MNPGVIVAHMLVHRSDPDALVYQHGNPVADGGKAVKVVCHMKTVSPRLCCKSRMS